MIVSDADEISDADGSPEEIARLNARSKAEAVARSLDEEACVIGADTIVVLDGKVYGKPADALDAKRMLGELSSRTHQVITGVCIVNGNLSETFAETTNVMFKQLSGEMIDAYVATGEPLDKAGAYGIQGLGGELVEHVDGDYDNVVGLPVERLQRALDL